MSKLTNRTLAGAVGGMLIVLAAAATSVWEPLAFVTGPGCLGIGYFYWQLARIVDGVGLKILRVGWILLGFFVMASQVGTPLSPIPILTAAATIAAGNIAVGLQPSWYPKPVWFGSTFSVVVPILAITAAFFYVVGAPTVGGVAKSSGVGFTVATAGLFAAHGIGSAIAAFGTDRVIAGKPSQESV